jgi:hypothetical protein
VLLQVMPILRLNVVQDGRARLGTLVLTANSKSMMLTAMAMQAAKHPGLFMAATARAT